MAHPRVQDQLRLGVAGFLQPLGHLPRALPPGAHRVLLPGQQQEGQVFGHLRSPPRPGNARKPGEQGPVPRRRKGEAAQGVGLVVQAHLVVRSKPGGAVDRVGDLLVVPGKGQQGEQPSPGLGPRYFALEGGQSLAQGHSGVLPHGAAEHAAGKPRPVLRRVRPGQKRPHAVAQQRLRNLGKVFPGVPAQAAQVLHAGVPVPQVALGLGGFPVARVVVGVHSDAPLGQVPCEAVVPAAVLRHAVGQQQHLPDLGPCPGAGINLPFPQGCRGSPLSLCHVHSRASFQRSTPKDRNNSSPSWGKGVTGRGASCSPGRSFSIHTMWCQRPSLQPHRRNIPTSW